MLPCPRCGSDTMVNDAPYREAAIAGRHCAECALLLVRPKKEPLRAALRRSRLKKRVAQRCPSCGEGMTRHLLSEADRMVELEVCRPCPLVVIDEDEIAAAVAMLGPLRA